MPRLPRALADMARLHQRRRAWRERAEALFAGRRADCEQNARAMIGEWARCVNLATMLTRPTLARLQAATCPACHAGEDDGQPPGRVHSSGDRCTRVCLETVRRVSRVLEASLLELTEPGTTPRFSPAVLDEGGPNLAREWRLIIADPPPAGPPPGPADPVNVTPPQPPTVSGLKARAVQDVSPPDAGAKPDGRARQENAERRCAPCSPSLAPPQGLMPPGEWPLNQTPQRRGEMLAAGASLRAAYPPLRRLSARGWRAIGREWYRAGWTPARIVHALDHAPDGRQHDYDTEVRHPARWAAARLDLWRDPATGQPLPPPAVVRDPPPPPGRPRTAPAAPGTAPGPGWQAGRELAGLETAPARPPAPVPAPLARRQAEDRDRAACRRAELDARLARYLTPDGGTP